MKLNMKLFKQILLVLVIAFGQSIKAKGQSVYDSIKTGETDHQNPVSVAAGTVQVKNEKEIVVKFKIHPGYHIYAIVSNEDPFIATEVSIKPPKGYTANGLIIYPVATMFNLSGTSVYENEIMFRQKIIGNGSGKAICKLTYQCCDATICFPPVDVSIDVQL